MTIRDSILQRIKNALREVDQIRVGTTLTHHEDIQIKEPTRSWRFLQQVILYSEMLAAITKTSSSIANRTYDLTALEQVLLKMRWREGNTGFKEVMVVARSLQASLRSILRSDEFIQIYGSFPNLAAGHSDIDVLLSERLDNIYFAIKGGTFSEGNFTKSESSTSETKHVSEVLLQAENSLRKLFTSTLPAGDLLSIYTLPRTYQRGQAFIEANLHETLRVMTLPSPITIRITKTKIVLEIHDGLSSPGQSDARIHSFDINPNY